MRARLHSLQVWSGATLQASVTALHTAKAASSATAIHTIAGALRVRAPFHSQAAAATTPTAASANCTRSSPPPPTAP